MTVSRSTGPLILQSLWYMMLTVQYKRLLSHMHGDYRPAMLVMTESMQTLLATSLIRPIDTGMYIGGGWGLTQFYKDSPKGGWIRGSPQNIAFDIKS